MPLPAAGPEKRRSGPVGAILLLVVLGTLAYVLFLRGRGTATDDSRRAPVQVDENGETEPTHQPTPEARPVVDKEVTIKEDHYYASIINLNRAAVVTVELELLAGPAVETWLMDEDGFRKFEKAGKALLGGNFEHFPDFHMVDVRHDQKSARLAEGSYYILVENTDAGSTSPPANFAEDMAKVRLTVTAE